MSCNLDSLKGVHIGDYIPGITSRYIKGDTKKLDYGSYAKEKIRMLYPKSLESSLEGLPEPSNP